MIFSNLIYPHAAGFDDYEEVFNGVKDSEGENGEDREEDNTV